MGMDDDIEPTGIEPICDLLVAWAGQGAQFIDHMARQSQDAPADVPPIDVVFRQLVRETLKPLEGRHPRAHLAAAADVLLDAQRTFAEEIFLVDLEGADAEG